MKRKMPVLLMAFTITAMLFSGCSQADAPENNHSETVERDVEQPADSDESVVYMTIEISPEKLIEIYEALGASPQGKIAVKLSTGEPGSNYLRTDLIGGLVASLDNPTIVECNTAYGGSRSNTALRTDSRWLAG